MSYALPTDLLARITDLRVGGGDDLIQHAQRRGRRPTLAPHGRLVILAADHVARMVTAVGDDPIAMCDRGELLGRIVRVLESGWCDGLMATPDIIEEVLAVDLLTIRQRQGHGLLDGKVLIGCMNRGGLAGAAFEMDDRFTAFTAPQIARLNLDGAKMMVRVDLLDQGSLRTLEACSRAINECVDYGLTVFLEPLPVRYEGGNYVLDTSVESLARICGVASALGKTSWKTWLKLPHSVEYSRVVKASLNPILVLGGPATGTPEGLLRQLADAMNAGHNVRGALVGRNVLYPGNADPAAVAAAVWGLVHEGLSAEEALLRITHH